MEDETGGVLYMLCIGQNIKASEFWKTNLKQTDDSPCKGGKLLNWILKEQALRMWTAIIWVWIGKPGGRLRTR